jgi:hypothetical protein
MTVVAKCFQKKYEKEVKEEEKLTASLGGTSQALGVGSNRDLSKFFQVVDWGWAVLLGPGDSEPRMRQERGEGLTWEAGVEDGEQGLLRRSWVPTPHCPVSRSCYPSVFISSPLPAVRIVPVRGVAALPLISAPVSTHQPQRGWSSCVSLFTLPQPLPSTRVCFPKSLTTSVSK